MSRALRSLEEDIARFWERVDRTGECWRWTLKKREFVLAGATRPITACAWIAMHGSLPIDRRAIHDDTCSDLYCVRHLILGTRADLLRRVHDHDHRGSKKGARHKRVKPLCPKGHAFTPENTVIRRDGYRRCKACARDGQARRRSRSHEQANPLLASLLAGLSDGDAS